MFLVEEKLAARFPIYPISGLGAWAQNKIGPPVRSTSEARGVGQSSSEKKTQRHDPCSQDQFAHAGLPEILSLEIRAKRPLAWLAQQHSAATQRRETHDAPIGGSVLLRRG